jgi:cbb3-type cytochrome c oxidase subunit I
MVEESGNNAATFEAKEAYRPIAGFFLSSAVWFVIFASAGFILASSMIAPDLFLYKNIPWLVFSRVRPVHTNGMIFGFVGSALMGALYYYVPHLVRAPLHSPLIARITLWMWNIAVAAGSTTLLFGLTQGREYAEYIWPIDVLVLIAFAMTFYNVFMTVAARKEKTLYVSVWYVFATLIFIFWIYFFGNAVWNPETGAIRGLADGVLAWFYGHGVVGLFLTPLAVAVSYYIIPIVSRGPLFSHTISLVGFWSILIFYPHIGGHHLLQTPIPTWLKVVSVTGSVGMLLPVLAVLVNQWLTMKGKLASIHANVGGKWVFAGLVWYLIVCLQGPFQALPIIQRVTHLTNWVIGHSHIAVLGFSGFIGLGAIYFLIPRITGRPIYSRKLADIQYWMLLIGLGGFWFVLTMAGLIQGNSWLNGETVYRTLPELHPYFIFRLMFAMLILLGSFIGLYNIGMSLLTGRAPAPEEDI